MDPPKKITIALVGCGKIGQAVLKNTPRLLKNTLNYLEEHCGAKGSASYYFSVVGVSDSNKYLFWKPGSNTEFWDKFIGKNLAGFKKWYGNPKDKKEVDHLLKCFKNEKAGAEALGLVSGEDKGRGGIALLKALEKAGQIPDIVIDVTPTQPPNKEGADPIIERIKKAFEMKASVVLANKAPIAYHFEKVKELSKNCGCAIRCEATVAAEIPFMDKLVNDYKGKRIVLRGIINGTTNFILSRMYYDTTTYLDAFNEAKAGGLTEQDPGEDTLGIDPARKLLIISKLGGIKLTAKDVTVSGITKRHGNELPPMSLEDLERFIKSKDAGDADYSEIDAIRNKTRKNTTLVPKLIAELDFVDGKGKVGLEWLDPKDPLAQVAGALNCILIMDSEKKRILWKSKPLRGAGPDATANAIFCDCTKIVQNLRNPSKASMF